MVKNMAIAAVVAIVAIVAISRDCFTVGSDIKYSVDRECFKTIIHI